MRSGIVITCSALSIVTDLMNHFPLFPLLLRIKDPRRLPGLHSYPTMFSSSRLTSISGRNRVLPNDRGNTSAGGRCERALRKYNGLRITVYDTGTNCVHFYGFQGIWVFVLAPDKLLKRLDFMLVEVSMMWLMTSTTRTRESGC